MESRSKPSGEVVPGPSMDARCSIKLSTPPRLVARIKDRKSTRLNSSHSQISYAVFCLKKKNKEYLHEARSLTIPHHRFGNQIPLSHNCNVTLIRNITTIISELYLRRSKTAFLHFRSSL